MSLNLESWKSDCYLHVVSCERHRSIMSVLFIFGLFEGVMWDLIVFIPD